MEKVVEFVVCMMIGWNGVLSDFVVVVVFFVGVGLGYIMG